MSNDKTVPESTPEPDETTAADDHVMGLLSEHVPLSLIVDLSAPEGPDSQEILTEEGEPEDAWWGVEGDGALEQATDDEAAGR